MQHLPLVAGTTAFLLNMAAFFYYGKSALAGPTKPNPATWIIWTVVSVILGSSYFALGAWYTMGVPIAYVICPTVIMIIALAYQRPNFTKLDLFCLAAAGISVLLWWWFRSATVAFFITLTIDFLGVIPTIRHCLDHPEEEDKTAWTLFAVGNAANILAVESLDAMNLIYPVYMFLGASTVAALVWFPRRSVRTSSV